MVQEGSTQISQIRDWYSVRIVGTDLENLQEEVAFWLKLHGKGYYYIHTFERPVWVRGEPPQMRYATYCFSDADTALEFKLRWV